MEAKINREVLETVSFLQQIMDKAQMGVLVTALDDNDYEEIVNHEPCVLNWLDYHPMMCSTTSTLHMGLKVINNEDFQGAVIGIYDGLAEQFHVILLEQLALSVHEQQLQHRLVSLVSIASVYFMSLYPNHSGVHIVEPFENLIPHYEMFGFYKTDADASTMYATFEELFECQQDLFFSTSVQTAC
ncbi:hypothetical protein [Vibrio neptunius]|uniref:Uncharacterized protein n=1 Tax=Vibrio neptunius TaxID=170651 RepID=A0ABS3A7H4_9VIBR|nr:hypothetical protein [Vibrio neptunius]MBN3495165.1 hypothetical protein [Vibrio neptunius]MBN3517635.1 hypothetical protein [Vibrio neptunius]MBN3552014.1 hypothetical protein [Vibrio neptunius]MBN3579980.1 hypothetical protein [Vibrio neptunius]MCH9873646.1 hypothetical protein [Vibrio neptunius]